MIGLTAQILIIFVLNVMSAPTLIYFGYIHLYLLLICDYCCIKI